ncbi:MAG: DNA repair exonuclease [Candidatus Thermoplasmatota archaeon]|nr:DNA repair exonuclease [Candidatus Thermoplasmatota archaeon]
MSRFAHISDIHLGSQRDPYMREWEMKSFRMAMDICVKKEVNFIVISGDLFHNSVPSLSVLNEVLSVLTGVRDAGIPVYVVYGSHDYSHDSIGAVDILETAGVITNVAAGGEKIFTVDPGTGAKITGISGRKVGLEKDEFASLNRDALENEEGFRIFVFHSAISEFKPPDLSEMESIEISYFPKGFDYYAGGHIHRRGEFDFPGYDRIVFPGPLYLGWQSEDI